MAVWPPFWVQWYNKKCIYASIWAKKHLFLGKKCIGGGSGGSGGMTEKLPPQAPLPPCCVNKNGALIFREKTIRNEFLRTFEEG